MLIFYSKYMCASMYVAYIYNSLLLVLLMFRYIEDQNICFIDMCRNTLCHTGSTLHVVPLQTLTSSVLRWLSSSLHVFLCNPAGKPTKQPHNKRTQVRLWPRWWRRLTTQIKLTRKLFTDVMIQWGEDSNTASVFTLSSVNTVGLTTSDCFLHSDRLCFWNNWLSVQRT